MSVSPQRPEFDRYTCDGCGTLRLPRHVPRLTWCPVCTRRGDVPLRPLRFVAEIGRPSIDVQLEHLAALVRCSDMRRTEERAAVARRLREVLDLVEVH